MISKQLIINRELPPWGYIQVSKAELEAIDEVQQLRAELVAAQRHAILKDEETNRILHNMKLEMDKLRHESSTRIRNLKQQMQAQAHQSATGTGGEMSRVKELEKQVDHICHQRISLGWQFSLLDQLFSNRFQMLLMN